MDYLIDIEFLGLLRKRVMRGSRLVLGSIEEEAESIVKKVRTKVDNTLKNSSENFVTKKIPIPKQKTLKGKNKMKALWPKKK